MPVRTVLGDVPASSLGAVYMHEHLIFDSAYLAEEQPQIHLPSVDEAVAEVATCSGVGAMIDAAPLGAGRDPLRLAEVSRRTGVAIVATTGLHTAPFYASVPWWPQIPAMDLALMFVSDIVTGIDRHDHRSPGQERTDHRAGIVKIATLGEVPDERESQVIACAAYAAQQTGAPILTHCEGGRGAMAQVELLASLGVDPSRVCLSHTDKVTDSGYHRDLLDTGVNLEYDQALRSPDATAALLRKMIDAGYLGRLMLGTDGARRSLWATLGGSPGLSWLHDGFPALAGLSDAERRAIFEDNPRRFLELAA